MADGRHIRPGAIDVHTHVTPETFPGNSFTEPRWPCMRCGTQGKATILMGEAPFREIDDRSWDIARRIEDMDRDGIAAQVLSPMPELLSYWFAPPAAENFADVLNDDIASKVAASPDRFVGLGLIPMQDTDLAIRHLRRLRDVHGLSGVEIGSNINGLMLGEPRFDPVFEAAASLGLAIFVHALHPVATRSLEADRAYVSLVGFPVEVAMSAASLIMAGTCERYPSLRIGFSHGGGALAPILHRLDFGWLATPALQERLTIPPREIAASMYYDSNVYASAYLGYLASDIAPGRVLMGTDYPYTIMQRDPLAFVRSAGLEAAEEESVLWGAAHDFLRVVVNGKDDDGA